MTQAQINTGSVGSLPSKSEEFQKRLNSLPVFKESTAIHEEHCFVNFRTTTRMRQKLREAAASVDQTVSAWLRDLILRELY